MFILTSRISLSVALDGRSTLLISTLLCQGGRISPRTIFPNPHKQNPSIIHWFVLLRQCLSVLGLLNVLGQGPQPKKHSWAFHPYNRYVRIGSPSKYVGLWAMPEDKQKLEDGQRDCWAWVKGLRTKEKNNGSTVVPKEPGHLGRALGR